MCTSSSFYLKSFDFHNKRDHYYLRYFWAPQKLVYTEVISITTNYKFVLSFKNKFLGLSAVALAQVFEHLESNAKPTRINWRWISDHNVKTQCWCMWFDTDNQIVKHQATGSNSSLIYLLLWQTTIKANWTRDNVINCVNLSQIK